MRKDTDAPGEDALPLASTLKGWAFVAVTSALLARISRIAGVAGR
jgi:hypothetical protein